MEMEGEGGGCFAEHTVLLFVISDYLSLFK